MANLPYVLANSDKVLGIMKMYSRMGAYPLDATSVFNTKADLEAYIAEAGSYAYPGQVVAVANGAVGNAEQTTDYTLYVIRSDKTVQEIGKNLTFSTMDAASAYVAANTVAVHVGELVTIADETAGSYNLYIVKADRTLKRVSFESTDIPDVTWANLQNKPTSPVADIDDAVTKRHEHSNKEQLDKIGQAVDGNMTYDSEEVAFKKDITWTNLQEKPTDVAGYGISDVYTKTETDGKYVPQTDVVTAAAAGKLLKLDSDAKLPADILKGIIPIENLPAGALERCVVVADDAARFALTADDVQLGDTVKVSETDKMYFVKDVTKLAEEAGYEVYTAGSATSVPWSGVTGTPTTLGGYGITDAVHSDEVAETAEAGKLLKLDGDAKLPASITGDADTVDGKHASDFVLASSVVATPSAADQIVKTDANGKLGVSITGEAGSVAWTNVNGKPDTIGGFGITDAYTKTETNNTFVPQTDVVEVAEAEKLLKLNAEGKLPADITGNAATASQVEWTGVQNKPTTLAGYGISDAVSSGDIVNTAAPNKVLKLDINGKLPADITGNAATASQVEWSGVQNKPTDVAGYGITDVYTKGTADSTFVAKTEVSESAEANKLLKLNAEGKLPASITGEAGSVAWGNVQNKPTDVAGYGITDVYTKTETDGKYVAQDDVVTGATANKLLKLNGNAKFPSTILEGIIPIENLPAGALERCVVVENDTARFALTTADVQLGDTVKVTATNKMYFVKDVSKLAEEAGYEIYTAGSATSVPWSGVEGKPSTLAGYGITDAYTEDDANNTFVAKTEVAESAEAGKLLKLNGEGKLPASITGEAGSVAWANITDKPTSAVADIDDAVTKRHAHSNKEQLDKVTEVDGRMNYESNPVAYMADLTSIIAVQAEEPANLPVGGLWFQTV